MRFKVINAIQNTSLRLNWGTLSYSRIKCLLLSSKMQVTENTMTFSMLSNRDNLSSLHKSIVVSRCLLETLYWESDLSVDKWIYQIKRRHHYPLYLQQVQVGYYAVGRPFGHNSGTLRHVCLSYRSSFEPPKQNGTIVDSYPYKLYL